MDVCVQELKPSAWYRKKRVLLSLMQGGRKGRKGGQVPSISGLGSASAQSKWVHAVVPLVGPNDLAGKVLRR